MIEFPIVDADNQVLRQVALQEEVFGRQVREDLLTRMVNHQLAARRSGSASTRRRSDVAGGGRKPFRQKGTGNARQGTVSAAQFRSGGVVFGPHPRSYGGKIPKKVRRLALQTALSAKRKAEELLIVDAFNLDEIKTRAMRTILETVGVGRTALIVLADKDEKVELSVNNLPGIDCISVAGVNVYDLLVHEKVILTEGALEKLQERLA